nr:MAG TPA_asm: Protein of unknown function (DUF5131) [Caudoviricetes sp.]
MGNKTKIDWCDATWNPVTGCLHGCEYCYARRIAERFGSVGTEINTENGYECDLYEGTGENHVLEKPAMREWKSGKITKAPYPFCFDPTFHRYKLDEPQHWKKPRNIFVCSMADLFGDWVPDEWIEQVFAACDAAPWHRYIFLTKNPKRLCRMAIATKIFLWNVDHPDSQVHPKTEEYVEVMRLPIRDNWWFGSTIDNRKAECFRCGNTWNTFTSIEPLTEYLDMGIGSFGNDRWTIIGAETGNRKGKITPKREWVENIVEAAQITGVKVFMKESLRDLMGADFRQEFPWEEKQ